MEHFETRDVFRESTWTITPFPTIVGVDTFESVSWIKAKLNVLALEILPEHL
jgi:hypothetical protein